LPVWHEKHLPLKGTPAQALLVDPPPWAGPAAYLSPAHTCMARMDFCRSDVFGYRGELFLSQWGTLAPLNSPRPDDLNNGFNVVRIDLQNGKCEPFMHNRHPGLAHSQPGSGGVERPVDCKFSPDRRSLYVLDFGTVRVTKAYMMSFAHTGVLWRVTCPEVPL
jgi:hypothetical protein